MAIVLNATWVAKPGAANIVREALEQLAPASRAEPGNLHYQVYQDPEVPLTFHLFEVYVDDAAVAAHVESPHFQRWGFGHAIPLLAERRREFFLTIDV